MSTLSSEETIKRLRDQRQRGETLSILLKEKESAYVSLGYDFFYELFSVSCLNVRKGIVDLFYSAKKNGKLPHRLADETTTELEFMVRILAGNSHHLRGKYFQEEVKFLTLLASLLLRDTLYRGIKGGKRVEERLRNLGSLLVIICGDFMDEIESAGVPSPSSVVAALSSADPEPFLALKISKKELGKCVNDATFHEIAPKNGTFSRELWLAGSLRRRRGVLAAISPALLFGGLLVLILPLLMEVFDSSLGLLLGLAFDLYITAAAVINIFAKPREYAPDLNSSLYRFATDIFPDRSSSRKEDERGFFSSFLEVIGNEYRDNLTGDGTVSITVAHSGETGSSSGTYSGSATGEKVEKTSDCESIEGTLKHDAKHPGHLDAMLEELVSSNNHDGQQSQHDMAAMLRKLRQQVPSSAFDLPEGVSADDSDSSDKRKVYLPADLRERFRKLRDILSEDEDINKDVADHYLSVLRQLPLDE